MLRHPWLPTPSDVTTARTSERTRSRTWRRTPAPTKIALAGENACRIGIREKFATDQAAIFTKLIPSPRVSVNASRTLIVGLSHLRNLSSLLLDWLNWSTWSWSMARIAAGESHLSSWIARGWVVRRCLVLFLYALRAFSKMSLKLEVDAVVAGGSEDEPGAVDRLMLEKRWERET